MAQSIKYSIFEPQPGVFAAYNENNILNQIFTGTNEEVSDEWDKISAADGYTTSGDLVGAAILLDNFSIIDDYAINDNYNLALQIANSIDGATVNPITGIVSVAGGGGGIVSVVAGSGIDVDTEDPSNPIVSSTVGGTWIKEELTGARSGNAIFTISQIPIDDSDSGYRNGLYQSPFSTVGIADYSRTGDTITFTVAPANDDVLIWHYQY
jgi:hypothetical protein